MTELVVFFTAQQHARKNIVNLAAIFIGQANDHFREEVRVEVKIDVLFPVRRRVKELSAAAFFKLQIEQNDIRRVEVVDGQLEENVVSLFKRLVFGQAIV